VTPVLRASFAAVAMLVAMPMAAADPYPAGFEPHKFNPPEQQPVTVDGVTRFHLAPGVCSKVDYGDGRGEYDCRNGNVRSILRRTKDVKLGESVEYRFDIRVDPSLAYAGFPNMAANGVYPGAVDSHLRIASWEGPALRNFIYMLKVSTTHGIDFLAAQCQAPKDFGKWVTFSLKTTWTRDDKGWVVARCDDRIIYADEGVATNQSPQCWPSNECEPWVPKNPASFNFLIGPVMMGFGPDWQQIPGAKGVFEEMQPEGITVEMRNITVTKGATLYDAAGKAGMLALQKRLNELGCNVGSPNGAPNAKTRAAALSCRAFPPGTLPKKLTVATVPAFLAAYAPAEVADLPPGKLPEAPPAYPEPEFVVHAAEEGSFKAGRSIEVNSNIRGTIEKVKKGQDKLFFIILGSFDYRNNVMSQLEFVLQAPLQKAEAAAVAACGGPTITFPDGSVHAHIRMQRPQPTAFAGPSAADCILSALPPGQRAEAVFLLDHFRDIAIGMARDGTIDRISHEGVAIFMRRVAVGDITLGRTVAD